MVTTIDRISLGGLSLLGHLCGEGHQRAESFDDGAALRVPGLSVEIAAVTERNQIAVLAGLLPSRDMLHSAGTTQEVKLFRRHVATAAHVAPGVPELTDGAGLERGAPSCRTIFWTVELQAAAGIAHNNPAAFIIVLGHSAGELPHD